MSSFFFCGSGLIKW